MVTKPTEQLPEKPTHDSMCVDQRKVNAKKRPWQMTGECRLNQSAQAKFAKSVGADARGSKVLTTSVTANRHSHSHPITDESGPLQTPDLRLDAER
ncbi:hypothetical protein FHS27_000788 [Rhodopirellula rubra]|uniref:Uncharacterized protein n=1 Tax=Aporhodopirellula rubra TaxID=980271 RepID=A0A7W5DUY5_9BACT|nr:hypothetical protein [Aporhodopirellula rubra]